MESQIKLAEQKARLRRLQPPSSGGGSFLGGFQGIDMQNVLGSGGSTSNVGGSLDMGSNLNNAMGLIGGSQQRVAMPRTQRRYRVRGRTKSVYHRPRKRIRRKAPSQPKMFNPFSQF